MSFTYVAIPYSHPDVEVRRERMRQFWRCCAWLIDQREHVVSPMTLEPALAVAPHIPYDWDHWQTYSRKLLTCCDRLVVLTLDGWSKSAGVRGEMAEAERLGIKVDLIDPSEVKIDAEPATSSGASLAG